MSIQVQCVQCGASHQVNDRLAGRRVRCPECDTVIHVPELEAAPEPADLAPLEPEPVESEAVAVEAEAVPVDVEQAESSPQTEELVGQPVDAVPAHPPAVAPKQLIAQPVAGAPVDDDEVDEEFVSRPERPEE